jgi:hypothetical protein
MEISTIYSSIERIEIKLNESDLAGAVRDYLKAHMSHYARIDARRIETAKIEFVNYPSGNSDYDDKTGCEITIIFEKVVDAPPK